MSLKDLKERLKDAVETENVPGTDYYGAEVDEAEVEAHLEEMEEATEQPKDSNVHPHAIPHKGA